jgi:serine/threonine-protein kinase
VLGTRYRFDTPIATGGMAEVWSATDLDLDRPVAIKVLHPHLGSDATFVDRFRREAVAAARLAHPGIVAIYDTYSGAEGEAIVMELVDGTNLRARIDQGRLDPPEAIDIAVRVAEALEVAHQAGLVHRDIKPANILLCDDQRVMVADFGIAKLTEDQDHTQEGTMLGTAKYLAPEQVEGKAVDGRTDVFSLGVVLFEMVCGQPPFQADTDAATALARLHHDAPLARTFRADVPAALEQVLAKAMAREPDERYSSVAELRTALNALGAGRLPPPTISPVPDSTVIEAPVDATPPGGVPTFVESERRWLLPALLIMLVAVALGVAAVLLGRNLGNELLNRDDGGGSTSALTPIGAEAFDPFGDGTENDSETGEAIDNDPATAWSTEGYNNRDFGNLKPGVGLIVGLDGPHTIDTVAISSPTIGWSVEIYVAAEPADTLDGWGDPVGGGEDLQGDAEFVVDGAEGAAVLVWITDLGDADPQVRATIAELVIAGT